MGARASRELSGLCRSPSTRQVPNRGGLDPREAWRGAGAAPCCPPARGDAAKGEPPAAPVELGAPSRRLPAGLPRRGSTAHQDPINGRNCFVKYQTLVARPDIGNRFIRVAGWCLLSPFLPLQTVVSAALETPRHQDEADAVRGRAPHPLPGALPPPVPPRPSAHGCLDPGEGVSSDAAVSAAPAGNGPGRCSRLLRPQNPQNKTGPAAPFILFFNYNPNRNTAVKCP